MANITITGNVVADPEYGVSQNGVPWVKFCLAESHRRFNDTSKQWETVWTIFHNCVAWRNTAEAIVENVRKGNRVIIEGEQQGVPDYTNPNTGITYKNRTQVVVNQIGKVLMRDTQGSPAQRQPQQVQNVAEPKPEVQDGDPWAMETETDGMQEIPF